MTESAERSIVIVEDEGLIAADLKLRLERAGYRVPSVADSGREALEMIRETSPDLVLMDIRIKGDMDGIQVAEQVRKEFDVPVVYLTAYEDKETLDRASQSLAFGYIKKPIASASLQGSIEMALSKHKHERYLREQRDWLSASFAAVPDAVVVSDGAGRICYVNRVAEELTGWTTEEALGRPVTGMLPFQYGNGQPAEDFLPVTLLQGTPVPLPADVWLEGGGGRRFAIEGSVAPRLREGAVEGVVIVFQDRTRVRFEEKQSREDHKHDALTRLANGIAGQLDMELSAVAEESTKLLESLPAADDLRSSAETIEKAALEAFAVTCRLRAFSQPKEIEPRVIRLNEVLRRLEATWKGALPGFELKLDPAPRPVQADSRELTRVLDILLQHAHQWMEADGSITVGASGAELEGLPEWVRIRIAYTTTSEDASAMERVFDPSWDGNWEGLPFAYGLMKRMGGLLNARMEGTKTVVLEAYLPSVQVAAAAATLESCEQPMLLVIDPNSEVRRVLHAHFSKHGYQVLEAGTCQEAVALAEASEQFIRLVLANPAKDDPGREEVIATLVEMQPGTCVRLLDGYREAAGAEQTCRYLTKWELLEWANDVVGPAAWMLAAH